MLDRAETLLHDHYAGKDYWDVRGDRLYISVFLNTSSLTSCKFVFAADAPQYGLCEAPAAHRG